MSIEHVEKGKDSMSEKKVDLRIRRTHKLLCDAMFVLLETKSFDEITVVDICEKAMVHRATFYKHFQDKYAFMEYVTKEKIREFYLESIAHKNLTAPREIYHALIQNVLHFIEENKKMLRTSTKSSSTTLFDSLQKIIFEELLEFLEKSKTNGVDFKVPADIVAQFLTGGLTTLVRWWIANEPNYSKQDMAKYIETMLTANSVETS